MPIISPPQLRTSSPGSRPLPVTVIDSTSWRIQTPEGDWRLTCNYKDDGHHASIRFPDGKKLVLPQKAVTAACRAISEWIEVSAWVTPDGNTHLSLGGTITATSSQGIFVIREQKLQGYHISENTAGMADKDFQQSYNADGIPIID